MKKELIKLAVSDYAKSLGCDGTVSCYRIGALALHNTDVKGRKISWAISHIPTGLLVWPLAGTGMRFADATKVTELLSEAFDWASVTAENVRNIQAGVQKFIREKLDDWYAGKGIK